MFQIGQLFVSLFAKDQGLNRHLNDAKRRTQGLAGSLRRVDGAADGTTGSVGRTAGAFSKLGRVGHPVVMVLTKAFSGLWSVIRGVFRFAINIIKRFITILKLAAVAAVTLGTASVFVASKFEEMSSKFSVVFGSSAAKAMKALDDFAARIGRFRGEVRGAAADIQDLLKPMGFAVDAAAGLSVQIAKLAFDLASFNNITDEEAVTALKAALTGSHETVKRFGVIINEATLKQELLRLGFKGTALQASEQLKVMARLNIIMRGTKDAQNDATRTAGSFANQMKSLWAQIKELALVIGRALMPAAQAIVTWLKEKLSLVQANESQIMQWGETVVAWVKKVLVVFDRLVAIVSNWELFLETMKLSAKTAWSFIRQLFVESIKWLGKAAWEGVKFLATRLATGLANMMTRFAGTIVKSVSKIFGLGIEEETDKVVKKLKLKAPKFNTPEFKGPVSEYGKEWENMLDRVDKRVAELKNRAAGAIAAARDEVKFDDPALNLAIVGKKDKKRKDEFRAELIATSDAFKRNLMDAFEDDEKKRQAALLEKQVKVGEKALNEHKKANEKLDKIAAKPALVGA